MACVLITYDLNREGSGYAAKNKKVTDHIKTNFPTWWHAIESVFIVETDLSALEVAQVVSEKLDRNDKLLTTPVSGETSWAGIGEKAEAWLQKRL